MLVNCLCVAAGGAVGSVCRYLLGLLPIKSTSDFPYITLGINVLGAFCIGLLAAAAAKHTSMDPRLVLLLKVGLCGGFTTFSTFCNEAVGLLQGGKTLPALLYMMLSVVLGVAAVFAGQTVAK